MPDIPQGDAEVAPETLPVVASSSYSDGIPANELVKQLLSLEKVVLPSHSKGCSSIPEGYELFRDANGNYYMKDLNSSNMVALEVPQGMSLTLIETPRYDDTHVLCIGVIGDTKYESFYFQVFYGETGRFHHELRNKNNTIIGCYGERFTVNDVSGKLYPVWYGLLSLEQNDDGRKGTKNITYGMNVLKQAHLEMVEIDGRSYVLCSGNAKDDGLYRNVTEGLNRDTRYFVIENNVIKTTLTSIQGQQKLFSDFGGIFLIDKEDATIPWIVTEPYRDENDNYYIWTGKEAMTLNAFIRVYNETIEQSGKRIHFGDREFIWGVGKAEPQYQENNVYLFEKRDTQLPDGESEGIWIATEMHLPESQVDKDGGLIPIHTSDLVIPSNIYDDEWINRIRGDYCFVGIPINKKDVPRKRYRLQFIMSKDGTLIELGHEQEKMIFPIPNTTKFRLGDFHEDFGYTDGLFYGEGGDWAHENIQPYWRGNQVQMHIALDTDNKVLVYTDSRNQNYTFVVNTLVKGREIKFVVCRKSVIDSRRKEYEPFLIPKDRVGEFTDFLRQHGFTGDMDYFLQEAERECLPNPEQRELE